LTSVCERKKKYDRNKWRRLAEGAKQSRNDNRMNESYKRDYGNSWKSNSVLKLFDVFHHHLLSRILLLLPLLLQDHIDPLLCDALLAT
jgi:hypothetical protein